jgi:hypothetical protein
MRVETVDVKKLNLYPYLQRNHLGVSMSPPVTRSPSPSPSSLLPLEEQLHSSSSSSSTFSSNLSPGPSLPILENLSLRAGISPSGRAINFQQQLASAAPPEENEEMSLGSAIALSRQEGIPSIVARREALAREMDQIDQQLAKQKGDPSPLEVAAYKPVLLDLKRRMERLDPKNPLHRDQFYAVQQQIFKLNHELKINEALGLNLRELMDFTMEILLAYVDWVADGKKVPFNIYNSQRRGSWNALGDPVSRGVQVEEVGDAWDSVEMKTAMAESRRMAGLSEDPAEAARG